MSTNEHAESAQKRLDGVRRQSGPIELHHLEVATAQVEATLAVVEELRTLSLATLAANVGLGAATARSEARERLGL